MEYRRLGNGGIKVSAVALGAWLTYGGSVEDETARDCIRTAIEHGVNYIDGADVYAGGQAERVTGQAIKDYERSDLVISSKAFWPMSDNVNNRGLSRKHIMESVEGSLRRLGTDYLDLYFCHRFDPETPLEETVRAMDDLVHQGKVLYWGTSVWEAGQIDDAVVLAHQFNAYRPQVEQPPYNMLNRHIEADVMSTCARHGMGITVFSPLAQGLLTGKYNDGIPQGSRADISRWLERDLNEENLVRTRKLTALAGDLGITPAGLALAWILRRPEISCVITGATRPEHVEANVLAAEIKLEEDVLARIEAILGNAP